MICNALKKFRSTTDPNNYYLTVAPIDKNLELTSIEERRLLPTENINKVLDSYGVMSYLSIERRINGKKPTSRVNQADVAIKITLYSQDTTSLIGIRVCYDNGNGINRWEKIEVKEIGQLDDLVEKLVGIFGVSNIDCGFRLYSLSTKVILDQDSFVSMVKAAQEKGQVLSLKLANENGQKSRLDPGRKTLDPGRVSHDPGRVSRHPGRVSRHPGRVSQDPGLKAVVPSTSEIATPISTLFNSADASIEKQELGFDELLSALDTSIAKQSSTVATPVKLGIGLLQMFETIEKDLESLISTQMRNNAEQRRSGRLSMIMIQKEKQNLQVIDPVQLFGGLKESNSILSRLEGNLNTMLSVILARNNLIDVS